MTFYRCKVFSIYFYLYIYIYKQQAENRLTIYSSTGCPLMMQEKAVELVKMMRPAMPIKTYGAVSENSRDKSMYLCMSNRAHKPIVRRIKPVN